LDQSLSSTLITTTANTEYIGLEISKNIITCCPAAECSDTQDSTLRDNSQGNTENFFTCGSARLGITFGSELVIRSGIASNFYPILKLIPNTQLQTATVTFYDGQTVSN
jgi:hypothetical protein